MTRLSPLNFSLIAMFCLVSSAALGNQGSFTNEIESLRNKYGFPGMSASYLFQDGRTGNAETGFADTESKEPLYSRPRMLGASTGKSFIGALVVTLAAENILNLDEPISKLLGEYHWFERLPNSELITLRHLVNHTSGLRDHVYEKAFQKDFLKHVEEELDPISPERLAEYILDQPPLFSPGLGWSYTDTGYILAGLFIEKATQKKCFELIREKFLIPLKLSDTEEAKHRLLKGLATGYVGRNNHFGLRTRTITKQGLLKWHPSTEWTGGGLVTTSSDLALWALSLFNGSALKGKAKDWFLESVSIDENSTTRYGAGIAIYESQKQSVYYGHDGWIPGYISSFRYYPDYELAVAFQINTEVSIVESEDNTIGEIHEKLLDSISGLPHD